ncbi:MAG: histidine kinase [Bacteroidia bacterium]
MNQWLFSQSYKITRYGHNNGLTSQHINAIAEKNNGKLLIGTSNGLFEYNGNLFSRPNYSSQIGESSIDFIEKIDHHSFLIYALNPNRIFLIRNDSIIRQTQVPGTRNCKHNTTLKSNLNYLVFRDNGVLYKKEFTNNNNNRPKEVYKSDSAILAFTFDQYNGLYVFEKGKLFYQKNGVIIKEWRRKRRSFIWQLYEAKSGIVYAWSNSNKILRLKNGKLIDSLTYTSQFKNTVKSSFEDHDGNIYFNNHGKYLYKISDHSVEEISTNLGIESFEIACIYYDKNGTYWVGTFGHGLLRLTLTQSKIAVGSKTLIINSIDTGKGKIVVGSRNGLFELKNDSLIPMAAYKTPSVLVPIFNSGFIHQVNFSNNRWLLSVERPKTFSGSAIVEFTNSFGQFTVKNGPSLGSYKNYLFTGFWGNIAFRDRNKGFYNTKTRIKPIKSFERVNQFIENDSGAIVVADKKIFQINVTNLNFYDTIPLHKNDFITENQILKKLVTYNQSQKQFLLCSNTGLFLCKYNNGSLEIISQLLYSKCNDALILADNIFAATNLGLAKIPLDDIKNPSYISEFEKSEINSITAKNEVLILGTNNGVYSYNTNAQLLIDKNFKISGISIQDKTYASKDNIRFNSNQNSFSINCDIISLIHNQSVNLVYTLNDGNFNETQENNINFNQLESGVYQLKIQAKNDINQFTTPYYVSFEILKPILLQTPILFLEIFTLILIIILIIKYRIKTIKAQSEHEKSIYSQITQLEKTALNLSLNPHFLFNSLNSIQKKVINYKDESLTNHIAEFSQLMRKVLDNSDSKEISLFEELEQLELYLKLEQRRFNNKFTYVINIADSLEIDDIPVPPMLLQPFVENSILHGILPKETTGNIDINIYEDKNVLKIKIDDNGVGFKSNQKNKTSKGIEITKKRLYLADARNTLKIIDKKTELQGVGVTVLIVLYG